MCDLGVVELPGQGDEDNITAAGEKVSAVSGPGEIPLSSPVSGRASLLHQPL